MRKQSKKVIDKKAKEPKKKVKPSAYKGNGMKMLKATGFCFLVLLCAIIGIWFASAVFLIRMKLPVKMAAGNPFLIFDYYKAYGSLAKPEVQKAFKLSFLFAAVITFLFPLLFLLGIKKRKSLYGEAKFATMDDIRKMGMLDAEPTSILMGKKNGRFLCYNGKQFGLLGAPTRSGKGVGWVIPNLLNYQHNVVVLDIKGENFEITSGWRHKKLKQKIFCFNPFSDKTHRWNALDYISNDPAKQVTDIIQLSYMFYPDPPNSDKIFFPAQARALFVGIVGLLKSIETLPDGKKVNCTLGEVLRFTGGNGMSIQEYIMSVLSWCDNTGKKIPSAYRNKLLAFVNQSDETRSSILGTFTSPLDLWLSKYVDNATSATDFDFNQLRRERMSIYVHIPPQNLPEARIMLNIFYSQLIMSNLDLLPEQDKTLKYQVCLMMDEFTAAGAINIINKSIQYIAGYNLRLMLIIQNKSQLLAAYGRENADGIMGNVEATIIYTPANSPSTDAKEYSDMLGYHSGKGKSTSRQLSGGGGRSESESEQKRALMLPQELCEMPLTNEIVLLRGKRPIFADKIEYWSDPAFADRIKLPEPTIPKWDIAHFINQSECLQKVMNTPEDLQTIKSQEIEGMAQFFSSVDENMSLKEQADLFAAQWAKYQGGSLENAQEMLQAVLNEIESEERENFIPDIARQTNAERQKMIELYGYDTTAWDNQAMSDPDAAAFALLPPLGSNPNEDEIARGNTSENGSNSFEGN
jgi:hypothetical protein